MTGTEISNAEARRFILYRQGLLGRHRYAGKDGVLGFIRSAGCIQFDPIDVCGKSPEIVLHSRVKGFTKKMLYELLYTDRALLDHFDKNLSIIPADDWKYLARMRDVHIDERSHREILRVHDMIIDTISERGAVCSADLGISDKVDWYWDRTKLSRAALEHMYYCGELGIHHKKGNIKYYDLIENCVSAAIQREKDPYADDHEHRKWRVLRRIGAVGMLWARASDAWLCIPGMKADERGRIFDELLNEGRIIPVGVQGMDHTLYCLAEDAGIFDIIREKKYGTKRCEFIAPLDNMMWDRELIRALWGFDYKWEIYTPQAQRKYGYYVLPILYGERFIGRIELSYNKRSKELSVLNIWYEPDARITKTVEKGITDAVGRFGEFCVS
ncbi:MAG: YcaQ family DNA glycosylase [Oscillospiraceae bacterium]|nr:YcaQ family DNA glycosylase [Oscillospiraceae bacterium]